MVSIHDINCNSKYTYSKEKITNSFLVFWTISKFYHKGLTALVVLSVQEGVILLKLFKEEIFKYTNILYTHNVTITSLLVATNFLNFLKDSYRRKHAELFCHMTRPEQGVTVLSTLNVASSLTTSLGLTMSSFPKTDILYEL